MALRKLRYEDDPILRKKARAIPEITDKIRELGQDMLETLYKEDGVGLAGPQVGILKRIIAVDFGDEPIVAVNPEIIAQDGEVTLQEACLSFPHKTGEVTRPEHVTVSYTDLAGNRQTRDFYEMKARCFCHEIDHLNGVVYIDKVIEGTLERVE